MGELKKKKKRHYISTEDYKVGFFSAESLALSNEDSYIFMLGLVVLV